MGHPARHRLARAAAYAAVTVAFAAGIAGYQEHADRQLRRNQVEACERGNRLQASFNLFVREAVRVRRASGLAGRDSAQGRRDLESARRCRGLLAPLPDCERVTR